MADNLIQKDKDNYKKTQGLASNESSLEESLVDQFQKDFSFVVRPSKVTINGHTVDLISGDNLSIELKAANKDQSTGIVDFIRNKGYSVRTNTKNDISVFRKVNESKKLPHGNKMTKAKQILEAVNKLPPAAQLSRRLKESATGTAGKGWYTLDKDNEPTDGPFKTKKEADKAAGSDETVEYGNTSNQGEFTKEKYIGESSGKANLDVDHLQRTDIEKLKKELIAAGLEETKDFFIKSGGGSWITYAAYDREPLDILMKYGVGEVEENERK